MSRMLLKLKVHADAREDRIERRAQDAFELWVRAPRKEGRANDAALALLARALGHSRFRLVKGHTSPSKIVEVFPESI